MTDETAVSGPVQEEIVTPAPPRFVGDRRRDVVVPLEWPLEFDGKTYSEIRVRRMTGAEVSAFVNNDDGALPMVEAPKVVIDSLDADDAMAVNKAITDFLPQSLRTEE